MAQEKHDFTTRSLRVTTATGGSRVIRTQEEYDAFRKEQAAAEKAEAKASTKKGG